MTVSVQNKNELTHFTEKEVQLIKNYLCKEIDDFELKFFSDVCKKTGLDPFIKQIYAIKRGGKLTIQTSIDGYRLVADRTGKYCPGREPTFTYDETGKLLSATSYVKKQTSDGTWHEVAATAFYSEYKPNYKSDFWENKSHIMLSKCSESLALRKAFPNELSQVYTKEEMDQADNTTPAIPKLINDEQYAELSDLIDKCSPDFQNKFNEWLVKSGLNSLQMLPENQFTGIHKRLNDESIKYMKEVSKVETIPVEAFND